MNEATFIWNEIYEEFATKLLEYKNDRKNLISKLQNVYEEIDMKLSKMESNGEILDIDPFTIFGLFNKGITDDNRKRILGEIAKQFNLKNKVPFSFEGIPLVNNLRSTFFNFAEERGENDINNLWEVFESAIRYADNPTQGNKLKIESTYNNVIKQKGIQWNITMGLYWIRPNTYINLDSKNREFIIKQKILPEQFIKEVNQFKNVPNGEQYIQLCDLLLEKIKDGQYGYRDFKELSFIAYERNMSVDTVTQHNTQNTDIAKNTILYGPPGTGKTYNSVIYAVAICDGKPVDELTDYAAVMSRYNELKKAGRISFTTFHQSYGYEEFIEGIKPIIDENKQDIGYTIEPGVFKKFCDNAKSITRTSTGIESTVIEENTEPYVFIIDEINRGNISKIFGELITLIESTKRAGMPEEASAILPYSGDEFSVPSNVYILGTMNTADRSIALMDTALRRRFQFVEMMPDSDVLRKIHADKVEDLDVAAMLDKINERIEYLYDREHTIGHAFFTDLKDDVTLEKLQSIFEKSVIPLLQEYFYEDYQKIQLVLGDNAKSDDSLKFIIDEKVIAKNIFKGNVEDVIDLPEKKYSINYKAFENINSYKEIL